ncbi:hypothetical protein P9239_22545 [Caballeronia sp. LZ062]|uniref:hypothetical protein n=1 Tax=unclassified Caballeronia TaxID=2646786 RepID=UPI0028668631|nr:MULTISPECIES: hypothetical protein [unclassified Caballeronia]MDR5856464.1 hypothetical protein [Caballeronia sp. LZ050]MDR5873134.1 hypothetical protein [Caballeronia sp. LZ062]
MTGADWMMAGVYLVELVAGTLFLSALARRSLSRQASADDNRPRGAARRMRHSAR